MVLIWGDDGNRWGWKTWNGEKKAPNDAKGYLPKVPGYDGDRYKDPKGYQNYKRRVENFVAIAKAVIPEEQIGARLYYEVTGRAFEYMEGTDASQFQGRSGWRILLKVLEHFDEKPILKVGAAMDCFFSSDAIKENETYGDLAVRIDQAAQKCFDCKLEIPDHINIRQFFQAAEMTADKRATVLMAAGSQYDWKKVKDQLDTLYPHPVKKKNIWNKCAPPPAPAELAAQVGERSRPWRR